MVGAMEPLRMKTDFEFLATGWLEPSALHRRGLSEGNLLQGLSQDNYEDTKRIVLGRCVLNTFMEQRTHLSITRAIVLFTCSYKRESD